MSRLSGARNLRADCPTIVRLASNVSGSTRSSDSAPVAPVTDTWVLSPARKRPPAHAPNPETLPAPEGTETTASNSSALNAAIVGAETLLVRQRWTAPLPRCTYLPPLRLFGDASQRIQRTNRRGTPVRGHEEWACGGPDPCTELEVVPGYILFQ